jgi:DNA-binding transcriptional MerR regulator
MTRSAKTKLSEASTAPTEPTEAEKAAPGFSYSAWYEANKATFNEDRKNRYKTDPVYRAKVLKWNRESRNKIRAAKAKERAEETKAAKVALDPRRFKTVTMLIDVDGRQVETELYSIGALALYLNRSIQVLRLWEAQGVIPETPYRNDKDRFYTRQQLIDIREMLTKQGRLGDQGGRQNQRLRPFLHYMKYADGSEKIVALYKVGVLAQALNRTIVTVEQMETREALPVTPFRGSATNYRLYTLDMVRAVKEAFDACDGDIRGEVKRLAFRDAVTKAWTEQGVFSATLGDAVKKSKHPHRSELRPHEGSV